MDWLIPSASIVPTNIYEKNLVEKVWKILTSMSDRLGNDHAAYLVNLATNHKAWNEKIQDPNRIVVLRKQLINLVKNVVYKLDTEVIQEVVEKSLPLALENKQDHDYLDAVDLLSNLASIGGGEIKTRIRSSLYRKDMALSSALVRAADDFGAELIKRKDIVQALVRIADHVRWQVQYLKNDDELKSINGSYGVFTVPLQDEKLCVHMVNVDNIQTIFQFRHEIELDELWILIEAILEMIVEKENLISNKIALVGALSRIGDVCDDKQLLQIYEILAPIARGEIVESTHLMSSAEANNPLNSIKLHTGDPKTLRGIAILVLACLDREKPGVFGKRINSIVELGLTDLDPTVRGLSLNAASEKSTLSEFELTALIMGTRDEVADTACSAFYAIANNKKISSLSRNQWRLLLRSASQSGRSRIPKLRRAAAFLCAQLSKSVPNKKLKNELDSVINEFSQDTCFTVRSAACSI